MELTGAIECEECGEIACTVDFSIKGETLRIECHECSHVEKLIPKYDEEIHIGWEYE